MRYAIQSGQITDTLTGNQMSDIKVVELLNAGKDMSDLGEIIALDGVIEKDRVSIDKDFWQKQTQLVWDYRELVK